MKRINDADYDPSNAYHYKCIDCQAKYEGMPGAAISVRYIKKINGNVFMVWNCWECRGPVVIREIKNE